MTQIDSTSRTPVIAGAAMRRLEHNSMSHLQRIERRLRESVDVGPVIDAMDNQAIERLVEDITTSNQALSMAERGVKSLSLSRDTADYLVKAIPLLHYKEERGFIEDPEFEVDPCEVATRILQGRRTRDIPGNTEALVRLADHDALDRYWTIRGREVMEANEPLLQQGERNSPSP